SSSGLSATESGITVQPAAASTLAVTGFPTTDTAGTAHNFTVTLSSEERSVATGYTGAVRFSSSDAKAKLPANYTFTASDKGTHTFSATLVTAGTQTLKATDTGSSSLTGSQSGITVQAAAASTLAVTGFPTTDTAGTAHNFTVTL